MRSLFSIVVPTYNGERFLEEAIASVQMQSRHPDELIIVDDASTDGTIKLATKLARESKFPIRIIELKENSGGPSKPINTGVVAATGDYILVLDQDDILVSTAICKLEDALFNNPLAACAFHIAAMYDNREENRTCRTKELLADVDKAIPSDGRYRIAKKNSLCSLLVRHGNFLVGFPGFAFRKDAFLRKGGVSESLKISGDFEFLAWLFQHGDSVYIPEIGYYRREHDMNACRNASRMFFELGILYSKILSGPDVSFEKIDAELAIANIHTIAYWFRKANMFPQAILLYRSLRSLNVSKMEIAAYVAKCHAEMFYASLTLRKPLITNMTRN